MVWQSPAGPEGEIFIAKRSKSEGLFSARKKLFKGLNPVISSDGKILYFYNPSTKSVCESRLLVESDEFGRPNSVRGSEVVGYPSGITQDGLHLYLDIHPSDKGTFQSFSHVSSRPSISAPWQKPSPVSFLMEGEVYQANLMGVAPVFGDDAVLSGSVALKKSKDSESRVVNVIFAKPRAGQAYRILETLYLPNSQGDPAVFFSPRYVAATRELFLQSSQLHLDSMKAKNQGVDLWVVKDLELKGLQPNAQKMGSNR